MKKHKFYTLHQRLNENEECHAQLFKSLNELYSALSEYVTEYCCPEEKENDWFNNNVSQSEISKVIEENGFYSGQLSDGTWLCIEICEV